MVTVTAVLLMGGCQDYLFRRVCGEQIVEESRTFAAARPKPADILFVVDNSASMNEEQQNLADNFGLFINQIAGAGDYRFAVISTDRDSNIEKAGLVGITFSDQGPYFPRTPSELNRAQCSDTNIALSCFRGDNAATRVIDSSALSVDDQIAFFQQNVRVGTCGSGREQGLAAMEAALRNLGAGECNAGFLRDDANLVVIFVSDENDTDERPVAEYADFLGTIKSYDEIRIAAIIAYADGMAQDCRTDANGNATPVCGSLCETPPPLGSQAPCNNDTDCVGEICFNTGSREECRDPLWALWNNRDCRSCSTFNAPDCCLADSGTRYETFAREMEARIAAATPGIEITDCNPQGNERPACLLGSVCEGSFGETLVRIARDLVIVNEYVLEPPATYPPGVRARLVGGRFADGGMDLVPGEDFVVGEENGLGVTLRITNAQRIPAADESLEVFYVSDVELGTNPTPDVCLPVVP